MKERENKMDEAEDQPDREYKINRIAFGSGLIGGTASALYTYFNNNVWWAWVFSNFGGIQCGSGIQFYESQYLLADAMMKQSAIAGGLASKLIKK